MNLNLRISCDRGVARRAFTLIELMVVVVIFAVVLGVTVPAVVSLVASSERAQAENQMTAALSTARAIAMSSEGGEDIAAVFFYEPGGRTRITISAHVGELNDLDPNGNTVTREVFVPISTLKPIQLPQGWMIRAYAPPGTIHSTQQSGDQNGWYENTTDRQYESARGNWIAPETGFYDQNASNDGADRQTFMVRFNARTGTVAAGSRVPAVVVDPSPSSRFRQSAPFSKYNLATAESLETYVRRLLAPSSNPSVIERRSLLGDAATDTVLVRSVSELALYDELKLAGAIGARGVNRDTLSIYGASTPERGPSIPTQPSLDRGLFTTFSAIDVAEKINNWIQATSVGSGQADTRASDAMLFVVDRYSGKSREITP